MKDLKRYYTIQEIATYLKCDYNSIYVLIKSVKIPTVNANKKTCIDSRYKSLIADIWSLKQATGINYSFIKRMALEDIKHLMSVDNDLVFETDKELLRAIQVGVNSALDAFNIKMIDSTHLANKAYAEF